MLEYPGRIFFSRWEKPDEENGWLYAIAYRMAVRAKQAYFRKNPEGENWWNAWNVLEIHGRQNPRLHVVEYEHFGVHPFPEEKKRLVYYPQEDALSPWRISLIESGKA